MVPSVAATPQALPPPGQPLDRGMSSLGLVMQVGALTLGVVIATAVAVWTVMEVAPLGTALVVVVLTAARVGVHAVAGSRLARGHVSAVRWAYLYAAVGLVQALALGLAVGDMLAGRIVCASAAGWPLAVAIAVRLRGAHATTTELRGEAAAATVVAGIAGLLFLAPVASVLVAALASSHPIADGIGVGLACVAIPTGVGILAVRGDLRTLAWIGQVIAVVLGLFMFLLLIPGLAWPLLGAPFLVCTCALAPMALRDHAAREPGPADPSIAHGSAGMTLGWILLAAGPVTVIFSAGGWTIGDPWLQGVVGAVELWAALELLAGARRAPGAVVVYAVAVIAVLVGGSSRLGLETLPIWALLTVPAVTLAIVLRPYVPLTRVRRGGA